MDNEHSVMDITSLICKIADVKLEDTICYIPDRLFNDFRYSLSSNKLYELGWKPIVADFENQITNLYQWYQSNRSRYKNCDL